MSITSRKVTTTTILRGRQNAQVNALWVDSQDFNKVIDDLLFLDTKVENRTGVAINATATATTAQIASGYITSTSAAATAITLPTATTLATALGAAAGTSFRFIVDNTAGADTVTIVVGTGITVLPAPVIIGTDTLTVATLNLAIFELVFTSETAATIIRIA